MNLQWAAWEAHASYARHANIDCNNGILPLKVGFSLNLIKHDHMTGICEIVKNIFKIGGF